MSMEILWNKLEIRVLLVASLTIQILLLFLAGFRKHVIATRFAKSTNFMWQGPLCLMFHWFLWLAYLLADYVATVALAFLRDIKRDNPKKHLLIFWAPFFLLHLGGQDSITALSIEDNELWARHLLSLVTQAALAAYNYFMSNMNVSELWAPAVLMFVIGCLKYFERVWSLQRASMSALRNSMITKPDPGPNYAKFMQEYTSSIEAGLDAKIIIEVERHKKKDGGSRGTIDAKQEEVRQTEQQTNREKYSETVRQAYKFFPRFKRLFVDLILSYKDREESQKYFRVLTYDKAYKLIEIELTWMYEILHSKASVIYSITYYGWISRAFTLLAIITSLVLFALTGQHGPHGPYPWYDVALTYTLLGVALALEGGALALKLMSLWTYAVMKECNGWRSTLADCLFTQQIKWHPWKGHKWSNKMAQFSLINYSILDKPSRWKSFVGKVGFKQSWDHYRFTTFKVVHEKLKELVFEELRDKMEMIEDRAGYKRYTEHRGQWALQRKGYYQEFGWSVEAEVDESILLWHIATDLLFNCEEWAPDKDSSDADDAGISQSISNYMMFLLIARPFMMPAGIGQIRFGDSSAEAKHFLQQNQDVDSKNPAKMILGVSTEYKPTDIKGDRSKSLLFDGCKLAHTLQDEFKGERKRMWTLISRVWVEMLCYVASKCSGQYHAKQLSKGGELLTVVWYLMAHLGMGEQYRIEQGHARAKLIISK